MFDTVEKLAEAVAKKEVNPNRMCVGYRHNVWEYCVQVWCAGELVYEYRAGNSPLDSQTYTTPDRTTAAAMRKYATHTAREINRALGCGGSPMLDTDIQLYVPERNRGHAPVHAC